MTPRGALVLAAGLVLAGPLAAFALTGAGEAPERVAVAASANAEFPPGVAPERRVERLEPAVRAAGCELRGLPSEGQDETFVTVSYRSDPPHSGAHAAEPAVDGAYPAEAPPTEALVHSLFHGRVLVWYQPSLPDAARGALAALYDEQPRHAILVPRESMPYEVAATAWTRRLTCPRLNDRTFDALRAFRDRYVDKGPELVP